MSRLSEFIGIPEDRAFKFYIKERAIHEHAIFKVVKDEIFVKYNDLWGIAYVDVNEIMKLKAKLLPEQILTDEERNYLKAVIAPVRDKVKSIFKSLENEDIRYIVINLSHGDDMALYDFEKNTQFIGMEDDRDYTLAELGLED